MRGWAPPRLNADPATKAEFVHSIFNPIKHGETMATIWYFVKLGLSRITAALLVLKMRNCVTMMTGNPAFAAPNPVPDPTLVEVTAKIDALDTAEQAYAFNRGKIEKETRDTAFRAAKEIFHLLGGYVQLASGGAKDIILGAGLDVASTPQAAGIPPAPTNVRAEATKVQGQIIVRWGASKGRRIYKVYQTDGDPTAPDAVWVLIAETGKVRLVVNDLVRFKTYSFRVIAEGVGGLSIPSDAASATAA